jgi:hypothetical protein
MAFRNDAIFAAASALLVAARREIRERMFQPGIAGRIVLCYKRLRARRRQRRNPAG